LVCVRAAKSASGGKKSGLAKPMVSRRISRETYGSDSLTRLKSDQVLVDNDPRFRHPVMDKGYFR
jgi:hypothetical protein